MDGGLSVCIAGPGEDLLGLYDMVGASGRHQGQGAQTEEGFVERGCGKDGVGRRRCDELAEDGQVAADAAAEYAALELSIGI